MTKTLHLILKIIRWIVGIFFSIISLGGFASGEIIFAFIILLIGLFILPPTGNWIIGLFSGKKSIPNFGFVPKGSSQFLKNLDIPNDQNLIQTIDNHFTSTEKPVSEKNQKNIGKKIYAKTLDLALLDLHLSDYEKSKLEEIINYFKLTKQEVYIIKNSLNKRAIETLIKKSYDDKILTDQEQNEIVELAQYLELNQNTVEQIKTKVASSLLNAAFNEKLKDKKLTPTEETELTDLLKDLKIDKEQISEIVPQKSLKQLAYAKLLWSLDNGIFYSIPNPPITMRKNEECYLGFQAQLLERKIIHKGYSYSSSSVSIPIVKGVRFRTGGGRAKPMKEEITIKHSGGLVLTNLRVVFSASGNKSFQIPFTKLLSFNVYSDGMEFMLDRKNYLLKIPSKDIELFAVGLTSSIRNFLDNENETITDAMKEIESNENFINL